MVFSIGSLNIDTAGVPTEQQIPDPFVIHRSRELNKRVNLNVGGVRLKLVHKKS